MSSGTMENLAKRIGLLEDRENLRELMTRYAFLIDTGQSEEWADCFTLDGCFEVQRPDGDTRILRGRDQLVAFAQSRPSKETPDKHFTSQVSVVIDGDSATSHCYFALLSDIRNDPSLVFYGQYHDEFIRGADGDWRFSSRLAVGESRR